MGFLNLFSDLLFREIFFFLFNVRFIKDYFLFLLEKKE